MTTRAACYLRVSDKELEPENQRRELAAWAERQGYQVVEVYVDTASGARSDRVALQAALTAAHRRKFDVLLIWALDRLSREGIGPMLAYLQRFHLAGVRVQSLREGWLDSGGPMWELLVAIFAWVAQQERVRIRDRILAGIARARAKGVRIGRPRKVELDTAEISALQAAGLSVTAIARRLGVQRIQVRRALRERTNPPPADPQKTGQFEASAVA